MILNEDILFNMNPLTIGIILLWLISAGYKYKFFSIFKKRK